MLPQPRTRTLYFSIPLRKEPGYEIDVTPMAPGNTLIFPPGKNTKSEVDGEVPVNDETVSL